MSNMSYARVTKKLTLLIHANFLLAHIKNEQRGYELSGPTRQSSII